MVSLFSFTPNKLIPREPHALAWDPTSTHSKIFRLELQARNWPPVQVIYKLPSKHLVPHKKSHILVPPKKFSTKFAGYIIYVVVFLATLLVLGYMDDCIIYHATDQYSKAIITNWNLAIHRSQHYQPLRHYHRYPRISTGNGIWSMASNRLHHLLSLWQKCWQIFSHIQGISIQVKHTK